MCKQRIWLLAAPRSRASGLVIALAMSGAGCSADVTRFDFPAFGLTNQANSTGSLGTSPGSTDTFTRRHQATDDVAAAPPRGAGAADSGRAYAPPPATGGAGDRVASARDYGGPAAGAEPSTERYPSRPVDRTMLPERRSEAPRTPASGESIQVQQGDTLYAIAKRHGVSISALIDVNALTHGSTIKPGQRLLLPAGVTARAAPMPAAAEPPPVAATPRAPVARAAPPPAGAPAAIAGWEGRHTMRAGESLYGIARRYKVPLAELQRVNGITEPTRVRIGAELYVPGTGEALPERHVGPSAPPAAPPRVVQGPPGGVAQPRLLNAPPESRDPGDQRMASRGDRATDAGSDTVGPPPAAQAALKFRWPVRGRIVANFGKRSDGTHNDGINMAVPMGTDIHAAESGRVAYAGSELKGYGNLILIRHDNGWVSAYAHADQILVKRDDVVRRGQIIAKAGKTGTVDQPQLHFELRQGSKPVDPLPHMERN